MNTFRKLCTGVYGMQSTDDTLQHGEEVTLTTKRGKEVEVTVWKRIRKDAEGNTLYSIQRNDGVNRTAIKAKRAERYDKASERSIEKSDEYYEKAQKHKDFLVLAEPIKVGHHSEKRHRKLLEDNWRNMGKSVELQEKANEQAYRAKNVAEQAEKEINLDTPDSLEALRDKVASLEQQREDLKASGNYASYQLRNLSGNIKRYRDRLDIAVRLWELDPEAEQAHKEARAPKPADPEKKKPLPYNEKQIKYLGLITRGGTPDHTFIVKEGRKYVYVWALDAKIYEQYPDAERYRSVVLRVEKCNTPEETIEHYKKYGGETVEYGAAIPAELLRKAMEETPCHDFESERM